MSRVLFDKPEINSADLFALIENGIAEDHYSEFKREMPSKAAKRYPQGKLILGGGAGNVITSYNVHGLSVLDPRSSLDQQMELNSFFQLFRTGMVISGDATFLRSHIGHEVYGAGSVLGLFSLTR